MNIVELIIKKRNGFSLTKEEIFSITNSFTKGKIPDYQFSALLMAICIKGMNKKETSYLIEAMLYSGTIVNLNRIKGPKIDKHSTGGVGDKTSLIIAPIVASAGVNVPMISGRGLGHTGGTLDKLDSIPGFRTDLNLKEYKDVLKKCGTVLIGQTKEIAPADKMFYQLRDVTGTVESFPLITGSIMSKKLAEGIDGLVLDVKTGSGAFMRKTSDALSLAYLLISTAKSFNKKVIAFITDMNQPLGNNVGNWLEVEESINVLKGKVDGDLLKLSLHLAGAMIYLGGKAQSINDGINIAKEKISNGDAYNKLIEVVDLQGGNTKFVLNPEKYRRSRIIKRIRATRGGFVRAIDTYNIGMASLELGAGRKSLKDKIDPRAGIILKTKIGGRVKKSEIIAELHSDSETKIAIAREMILNSISYSNKKVAVPRLIKKIIN